MNWHTGNIAEAVAESKAKDAIFVVYTTGQDEMSANLDSFLNDSRVYSKLQSSDFVAVKIQRDSETYVQFSSIYKVVPVPSIFFIGKSGTPLDIATGIVASVEELVAKVNKVLILAGKQPDPEAPTNSGFASDLEESKRSIAGADDENSQSGTSATTQIEVKEQEPVKTQQESVPEAEVTEPAITEPIEEVASTALPDPVALTALPDPVALTTLPDPVALTTLPDPVSPAASPAASPAVPSAVASEPKAASLTAAAAAEKRVTSAAAATASPASVLPAQIQNLMPLSVPLIPAGAPAAQGPRSPAEEAEMRMIDIQNLAEQRRNEREDEQKQRNKDNELRRRRERREAQVQPTLTREQELKQMQERLKRDRQQEQENRGRILAQIAADRAEQATRRSLNTEIQSNISSTTTTTHSGGSQDYSISSVEETRLQIRIPGGLTRTKTFPVAEPLATVREYVHDELLAGTNIREFTMAATYPRREFKLEDEVKSLNELNLVPNAVLLVLKSEQVNRVVRSSNSIVNIVTSMLWAILIPAAMAFDYLNRMGLQRLRLRISQLMGWSKPAAGGDVVAEVRDDAASRRNMDMFFLSATQGTRFPQNPNQTTAGTGTNSPQGGEDAPQLQEMVQQRPVGFKPPRYGESNIRRLADTKDDEEDKSTYNGNSTQQQ